VKRRGQVLGFDVKTTATGWIVTITHRSGKGGIEPVVSEHAKFAGVLAHINSIVDTCGVER